MNVGNRFSIRLIDAKLFLRKIEVVFVATGILVPLVYFKLYVPAGLYIVTLLVLHVIFLYTYFTKVSWLRLAQNRVGLGVRILAIGLLIYLLAVLKFHGSFEFVLVSLVSGLVIHASILLALTAEFEFKVTER